MLYTVYKTTNLANGKYYFGVHKTDNPNDDYLGSGKYIKAAIAKHGEAALKKEVLFIYLDAESAFGKEDELIQTWRGRDPLCMNLRKGGSGGFDWINKKLNQEWRKRAAQTTNIHIFKRRESDIEYKNLDVARRRRNFLSLSSEWYKQRGMAVAKIGCAAAAKVNFKAQEHELVLKLYKQGISKSQIVRQVGVAKSSVFLWIKQALFLGV
jgi:hypothetical protein